MIKFKQKGDFSKTKKCFNDLIKVSQGNFLDKYGARGVDALSRHTPVDTGKTSASWYYEIQKNGDKTSLVWGNSNTNDGVLVAILLQYGHATGNGGYVVGVDYINPAMKPIFEEIVSELEKELRDA